VDGIRSIDSVEFHRLFTNAGEFSIEDGDALVSSFMLYEWIVSFMGHGHSDFEDNLIFAVHCSHSAEITILPLIAETKECNHISEFYIQEFLKENALEVKPETVNSRDILVHAHKSDIACGQKLLGSIGIKPLEKTVIIHPGSGSSKKCWHVDNFCMVAEALSSEGVQVVFLLGPREQEYFDHKVISQLKKVGKCISELDLMEVVQIISCSDLFLGNDSGITHLSAAMGGRTLAIFGDTDAVLYKPLGPNVRVYSASSDSFGATSTEEECGVRTAIFEMLKD
jgi:hypothetical protein